MKVPPVFEYVRVDSLNDLYKNVNQYSFPLIISGGTVAVLMLKNRVIRPDAVIDISGIEDLNVLNLDKEKDEVFMGSNIKLYRLKSLLPDDSASELVTKSASTVGDIAIRSVGSVGGNVCLGDPGNDLPVALTAIGAYAVIGSQESIRRVPVSDFYVKPFKNVLKKGEILLGVSYKRLYGYRTSYKKHFLNFLDHYVGIVAALAKVEGKSIKDLRMAAAGEAIGTPVKIDISGFSSVDDAVSIKKKLIDCLNSLPMHDDRFGTIKFKKRILSALMFQAIDEVLGP
ncbi:MAG: FAD binding domain-containing protein [Nitrososphaeria archaeon]|nr:FAD binding domain-containing protein [Conexivisphaerales archaeon]